MLFTNAFSLLLTISIGEFWSVAFRSELDTLGLVVECWGSLTFKLAHRVKIGLPSKNLYPLLHKVSGHSLEQCLVTVYTCINLCEVEGGNLVSIKRIYFSVNVEHNWYGSAATKRSIINVDTPTKDFTVQCSIHLLSKYAYSIGYHITNSHPNVYLHRVLWLWFWSWFLFASL